MPNWWARGGRWALLIGLGAIAMVGLTGCRGTASGESTSQSAPSAPSTSTSTSDVLPRSDLRDEHRIKWSRYDQVGDREIRVHFLLRDPRCFGVRPDVRVTREAILITVLEGSVPDAPQNCTLDAAEASLLVRLEAPVGGRPVTQP